MTRHDEVFAMFVEANPVSTLERDATLVPDVEVTLRLLTTRTQPEPLVATPSTVRRRWLFAAAAFVLVIAAVGLSLTVFGATTPAPPVAPSTSTTVTPTTGEAAQTTTTTTTTTTADPLAAVVSDAEAAALEFLAAIASGDVDAVMALSTPDASDPSDRRVHEFNAAFAAAGMPLMSGDCTAEEVTESSALVRCDVRLGDVVALELGLEMFVYPFRYQDGLLAWQQLEGIDIGEVNRAYADYLRAYLPDRYAAACSPGAYAPGSIVQSNLLALTGECGELAASVADDVVAWIRAGRPLE